MTEITLIPQQKAEARAKQLMYQAQERYWALSECLTIIEANVRNFSWNETGLHAREGYEKAFERERRKAEVVREMMREARDTAGF